MAGGVGVDAKGLEGRKDGENAAPQSRDFFWDSITLFVVGAIVALSAIDAISEFIRGSQVQCYYNQSTVVDQSLENLADYVNEKCAASLPLAEFLPSFIAIHAILILAPHYIWLNMYGADLDSFFHLVSRLSRTREPSTGDYPETNYTISKQLNVFSSGRHKSNFMYGLYALKLFAQIIITEAGFVVVFFIFSDFGETFTCPRDSDQVQSEDWPLSTSIKCVFTSLRLLHKIWLIYIVLLQLAAVCLFGALVWLVNSHANELAHDKAANFSFQTCLPFYHYTPPFAIVVRFSRQCSISQTLYALLSFILPPSFGRNNSFFIKTDYDFLAVKLFRTDGGLAQVLREVHMSSLLKGENSVELARVSSHRAAIQDKEEEMVDPSFLKADLGWSLIERPQAHKRVDTELLLPRTIRGVVLGFSALCMTDQVDPPRDTSTKPLCGALCIVFDSESVGFAGALARVFRRVAVINFSKSFSDYANPGFVHVNDSSMIMAMTVPHDIVMADHLIEAQIPIDGEKHIVLRKKAVTRFEALFFQFYDDFANEIWKPGYIYSKRQDEIRGKKREIMREKRQDEIREEQRKRRAEMRRAGVSQEQITAEMKSISSEMTREGTTEEKRLLPVDKHRHLRVYTTDYVVIGPITSELQRATVNMFLDKKEGSLSENAVLVTITPLAVSGVRVDKNHFKSIVPYGFKRLDHKAFDPSDVNNVQYTWPPNISNVNENTVPVQKTSVHEWVVTTGDTSSKVRFSLFTRKNSALLDSSEQSGATGSQSGPMTSEAPGHTTVALPKSSNDNSSDTECVSIP